MHLHTHIQIDALLHLDITKRQYFSLRGVICYYPKDGID